MTDEQRMASMKFIFEKTSDPAERTALTNAVINDGLLIEGGETVTLISPGLFRSKSENTEYEFKINPGTKNRVHHGTYKRTYTGSKNYELYEYEDGKRTYGKSLDGKVISTCHYPKDGSASTYTSEDFSDFPNAKTLDPTVVALKRFKKALKEDIELYCTSHPCRNLLQVTSYDSKNEKIMEFLRNLCEVCEYRLDEPNHKLYWR